MSQATLSERPYVNSNLFSSHYLDERIGEREEWDCDEEARVAMEELLSLYELEGSLVSGYGEDALIDNWIGEVLDTLGFGTQEEVTLPKGGGYVDELLFETPTSRREAASVYLDTENTTDLFERGLGLLEAKQWDADFTQRFSEQRPYRNASHQIKHYLENTPDNLQWGVLTNGRKWRLYGTKDYETQTYYEVDLPELLERGDLETFKFFYVFFRPDAFRESAGTTFLDEVWSESETASQELGEDLQDNVFTALRVLGRGFIETNDLDIDSDDKEALAELKDQSLVLLYRLMFLLYAEARGLIHPEGRSAQAEYEENFSLDSLRLEVHGRIGEVDEGFDDEFSEYSTGMWSRLEDLFRLIDKGEESLGIPPYNGGLFDHDEHEFLTEHEVSNRFLAEVIYRLSTTQNGNGRYVLADYADLDTRHLGSVYEGLLEHQFQIAPEEYAAVAEDGGQVWKPATEVTVADAVETVPKSGLFVVNDEGERKATGAYYTPDYVVTYIVEETVGPMVDEIEADLRENGLESGTEEFVYELSDRILELRVLDPAMGSGHFLTKATGYLAERVMSEVRNVETELGTLYDEQIFRRDVAKECIYGVDLNGMAVELAKLSMWLETLAADRPLAFLDHHLREGNSLVGSDITEILSEDEEDGQITLTQAFARIRQRTLMHVMGLMQELLAIDNETRNDIESMKELYDEIRQDPLYGRLFEMANVYTANQFGIGVPDDAFLEMAESIEDSDQWNAVRENDWFQTCQSIAEEQSAFHWELEFPEVFFNKAGEKHESTGFDAVVGNPPYITFGGRWTGKVEEDFDQALRSIYPETAEYKLNTYSLFMQRGIEILGHGKRLSYITPDSFLTGAYFENLREYILSNCKINGIFLLAYDAWDVGDVGHSIICNFQKESKFDGSVKLQRATNSENFQSPESFRINQESFYEYPQNKFYLFFSDEEFSIFNHIWETCEELGNVTEFYTGLRSHVSKTELVSDSKEGENWKLGLEVGKDVRRYVVWGEPVYIEIDKEKLHGGYDMEKYEGSKLFMRKTGDTIVACRDTDGLVTFDNLHTINITDDRYQEEVILAILNSKLIEYYYNLTSSDSGRVLPQLNIESLEKLPIPVEADDDITRKIISDVHDIEDKKAKFRDEVRSFLSWIEREWGCDIEGLSLKTHLKEYWEYDIDELVRIAKKNVSKIDGDANSRAFQERLESEWESSIEKLYEMEDEMNDISDRIDESVYKLYGLDDQEIKTIEATAAEV